MISRKKGKKPVDSDHNFHWYTSSGNRRKNDPKISPSSPTPNPFPVDCIIPSPISTLSFRTKDNRYNGKKKENFPKHFRSKKRKRETKLPKERSGAIEGVTPKSQRIFLFLDQFFKFLSSKNDLIAEK